MWAPCEARGRREVGFEPRGRHTQQTSALDLMPWPPRHRLLQRRPPRRLPEHRGCKARCCNCGEAGNRDGRGSGASESSPAAQTTPRRRPTGSTPPQDCLPVFRPRTPPCWQAAGQGAHREGPRSAGTCRCANACPNPATNLKVHVRIDRHQVACIPRRVRHARARPSDRSRRTLVLHAPLEPHDDRFPGQTAQERLRIEQRHLQLDVRTQRARISSSAIPRGGARHAPTCLIRLKARTIQICASR